ncbi:MAG: cyanophycin synthetase, partial [Patescibacteria group bacterium]
IVTTDQVVQNTHIAELTKSTVVIAPADIFDAPLPHLIGEHNKSNAALAISVARIMDIPDKKSIQSIQKFKGLPFRIEFIGLLNRVPVYNDSTSTTPIACETALSAISHEYPNRRILLVIGGNEKKLPFDSVVKKINETVSQAFLLKGSFTNILLHHLSIPHKGPYDSLKELVEEVLRKAKAGDVILFSPAATSFATFKNEFDRGEQFSKLITLHQKKQNAAKK